MMENNPLMEINTSFSDYLAQRTRSYQEHVIGGTLDYAFDADFAMRQKIGGFAGWSKLYKTIVSADIPNRYKRYFQSADVAGSMQYAKAYEAAKTCSDRLQISLPEVLVKKAGDIPDIFCLVGDGVDNCIVMSRDIAEMCTHDELCYLIGCECGRIQNRHCPFNYAFTYPGISKGDLTGDGTLGDESKSNIRELNYNLNKWLVAGDITADRAGIICLDDPTQFPKIFASVRRKGIPDSYGKQDKDIDIDSILEKQSKLHITPVRELRLSPTTKPDERRVFAGSEFITCEILYIWRPDLERPTSHISNKQTLEIRCDIIADMDEQD